MPAPVDDATTLPVLSLPGRLALVAGGGAAGTLARAGLDVVLPSRAGLPWAIVVANVAGALLLGVLLGALAEGGAPGRAWLHPLLATGVLGAFTTFSTLAVGVDRFAASGRVGVAVAFALGSVGGGLVAALAGVALGRAGWRRRRADA